MLFHKSIVEIINFNNSPSILRQLKVLYVLNGEIEDGLEIGEFRVETNSSYRSKSSRY